MKAYKIFDMLFNEKRVFSLFPHVTKKDTWCQLEYKKSEKNIRRDGKGPFCAFNSIKNAKKFIDDMSKKHDYSLSRYWKIFEIECKKSDEEFIYDFIEHKKHHNRLAKGTVLVDEFKILKRSD